MLAILLSLIGFIGLLHAAIIPLALDGALDSATADSSAYNTGGRISVNGISIKVPKNLQFQLPAAWVPFKDIAAGGYIGMEVSVFGNILDDGTAIAGIVQLAEFALEGNTGVIASLSYDGKITMIGGQVVRINDPNAVYSAGYTAKPAFTADDVNPSITAFSGFPMCVPRSADDAKCPASNRPAGRTSFNAPDQLSMVPFLPGDYIEFEGVRVGSELIAYGMTAVSVQVLTTGMPPYIRVEDALIGVFDGQSAANVEFAESRFVGYTSDSSVSLSITRSEVDPCTGKVTDVSVGAAASKAGDVRNKWTWRADSTTKVRYAREYKVTASTGTKATNSQVIAGQYITPAGEWIFPEIALPGAFPGKNDFSQFTWITNGLGQDADGNIWGPLDPSPDGSTITTKICSAAPPPTDPTNPSGTAAAAPVANAGPDIATRPGISLALAGKAENASSYPAGDLSYSWKQSAGPAITLANSAAASASFTVPNVTALTSCTFSLTVSSKASGLNTTDDIVVSIDPKALDSVVIDSYTWTSSQSGTLSITAHSNVIDGSARLSMVLLNPTAGAVITLINNGGGKFTYSARATKKPTNGLTVSSSFGGKQTIVATTSRRRSRVMRALKLE